MTSFKKSKNQIKEEGSAPPFPVFPLQLVGTGVPTQYFSWLSQTTLGSVKWAPHYGGCLGPARLFSSVLCTGWGLCPSLPVVKIVRTLCSVDALPCARLSLAVSFNDILQSSEFMVASLSSRKSGPNRPAASVWSGHTKNGWFNLRPPKPNETVCRSLNSRVYPVTP